MKIPDELFDLINEGIWPENEAASLSQNLKSVIPPERIREFAPEEERLYLYPPPFHTAQDEIDAEADSFWLHPMSAVDEIDPRRSLIIGDFGLGSDAAIILDYRHDPQYPRILRLRWSSEGNHWVECAKTFSEFASHLRDTKTQTEQDIGGNGG
jgi:hypothetical protein